MNSIRFFLAFIFLLTFQLSFGQDSSQTFLSLKQTGVEEFLKLHPEYDGRGTIVFVFDTGVDMGVEGLLTTSTGEVKVIDVQDFTGQGDIPYFEAEIDEDDGVSYFINEDKNYKIAGADKLSLKANEDNYFIGLLPESLWLNSGSGASDINNNGKEDDNFYFVVFQSGQNGLYMLIPMPIWIYRMKNRYTIIRIIMSHLLSRMNRDFLPLLSD